MTARPKPPPWLDLTTPQTDRARIQRCPWCHQPIIRALVGNPCGLDTRTDPAPLGLAAELEARRAGRFTYCLRLHPHLPPRLLNRGPEHIAAGRCPHVVVADHQCTRTAQPPAIPAPPQPAPNRLF